METIGIGSITPLGVTWMKIVITALVYDIVAFYAVVIKKELTCFQKRQVLDNTD